MKITRRRFLAGSVAVAAMGVRTPDGWAAPLPKDIDVAVIGAGAAGIAAARQIAASGRKVVVLEATDRIGGRCFTDTATFSAPFDRGARWLFSTDSNPVAKLVRGVGIDLVPAPRGQRMRIGRRNARAAETEDFLVRLVRANRAIGEAGRGKGDVAAASALPQDLGEWDGAINFLLGPAATGKDLRALSAADLAAMQTRDPASATRQGVGTLIAKLGASLPVVLSTPVTRIAWGSRGEAQIETAAGTLSARAVIVTVSTNVLTSGKIKFTPDLPKRQLDAADKLGLGSTDRVAIEFNGNPLGLSHNDAVIEQSRDNRTALLLANVNGSSLCHVDVAGSFGRDLAAQGEQAMTAFATEWLVKLYGSDLAKAVAKTAATRWNDAPYVLGAMSAAAPGGQSARKTLMESVGNLYFAGEAVHETGWGTVGGAWESGERAAAAVLRKLGGAKDSQPSRKSRSNSKSKPSPRRAPSHPRGSEASAWPRR
jgi:monoamine oxidase